MTADSITTDYASLTDQVLAVMAGETDVVANLANTAAVLFDALDDVNWVGFYLVRGDHDELIVGPFQGKPACVRIPFGRGVCGTAAATLATQLVADVHAFPGHIACDAASRSEIVVPLVRSSGELIGVLDVDSPTVGRFSEDDRNGLEMLCAALARQL